ncbi:MAG: hypothetical protein MUF58_21240, partial [Arcicella sp.]|nr:hypothetical protein [Arcicella sp.]
ITAGENFKNKQWIEEGLKLLTELDTLDLEQQGLDVIDGAAGTVPLLVRYAEIYHRPDLLAIAQKLGNHLIQKAQTTPQGSSWNTAGPQKQNLTGQAHGASGIATGLLELFMATQQTQYRDVALNAFRYENHHFSHQHKNWADFRDFSQITGLANTPSETSFNSCAWCHGAAGIALSRLRAYEILQDAGMKKDAELAIQKTIDELRHSPQESTSLCHGIAGNADILLSASQILNRPDLLLKANESGNYIVQEIIEKDIPLMNGLHNTYQIPDMMLGVAGVGYFLLRLYNPAQFESILMIKGN